MWNRIRIAADAVGVVESALSRLNATEQAQAKQALVRAAGQDGNRYLTRQEAQVVLDAFEEAPGEFPLALDLADAAIAAMASASNVNGVSAHFTFQDNLAQRLVGELEAVAKRADGRPAEVGMLIFQFQSKEIREAVVDLARKNPNLTFRIVGDSTQASRSGGNALPSILDAGLPNIEVKFKKDFPYTFDARKGEPAYNHGASAGLNHHKGFVSVIDGEVDRLVTGSFNWSDTANLKNYEDLVVVRAVDASTRRAATQFLEEFTGFFNSDTTLSPNAFENWRREQWNQMSEANGGTTRPFTPKADDAYAAYRPSPNQTSFDVNGFRPEDVQRLDEVVGKTLSGRIRGERSRHGRFHSADELFLRVPDLARLTASQRVALEGLSTYGSHTVSINNASVQELDLAGFSLEMAKAIVDHREAHGDFESVEGLLEVPGMTRNRMAFARKYLEDDDFEAFFNSRPFGEKQGGTGYGEDAATRTTAVMTGSGAVERAAASVTAAATDLIHRAVPGQRIDLAMYGMSTTAPEYLALVAAARRGVEVRVVVNDSYTERTVAALVALRDEGLPVDVRVQTAKTMHQKFGVVGDDVFFGSANFSESSSTKHSENRVAIKNNTEISSAFQAQFELLWARSKLA